MPIENDNLSRSILEQLQLLAEGLGSRNDSTREAIAEAEVLSEEEKFLRRREQKEREQAAQALKDARDDEAKAIWNSLSDTEKQIERQKELDAEANKLTEQQNQKDNAYGAELNKINEAQKETFARRAKYELESLGFQRDSHGKLHQLMNEREEIEKQIISDLQKNLDESPDLRIKYGADAKNAKLALDQEKLYKQQLASMGRTINEYGKITDTTVKLNKEQEASIRKIKAENEAREKAEKALEEFKDMFGKKGAIAAGSFVLTAAFDFLKAGVVGTYKGLIAYEDALLDGVRGQSVAAAMVSAQAEAYASSLEKTGGGMVDFGATMMAVGVQVTLATGPIGLLAVAIGGLLAILGYASQAEAEIIRRDAKLNKDRAALEDEAFKNFLQLGEASVTGARGVTGLIDDLKSVGLTIKEFEKLNKILSSNTREIAMFGSTTMAGAKSFIEVTGGLINSKMSRTFEKMGISQNAQMEHAQKYMAMQARFGLLEGKSKQDLIKGTQNYISELDKTAALTGASRKEQENARDLAMAQSELRAAIFDEQEKAKGGDKEAELRVLSLQRQMDLVSKLELIGQKELATGTAKAAANNGQIVDSSSAKAIRMIGGTIEQYRKGEGTAQTRLGTLSNELRAGFKELAPLARIKSDAISGLADLDIPKLLDGINTFDNANKLRLEWEKDPKNKGKPFDEKAMDQMLSRVAKDPRTTNDVNVNRATQEEALTKQTQLLNGQLGAANQMKEAGGMFGKAASSMLTAAKQMYNAAFKGTEGKVENTEMAIDKTTGDISKATAARSEALARVNKEKASGKVSKEAQETLELWDNQLKILNQQLVSLEKQKKLYLEKSAIEKRQEVEIATLKEKQRIQIEQFDGPMGKKMLETKKAEWAEEDVSYRKRIEQMHKEKKSAEEILAIENEWKAKRGLRYENKAQLYSVQEKETSAVNKKYDTQTGDIQKKVDTVARTGVTAPISGGDDTSGAGRGAGPATVVTNKSTEPAAPASTKTATTAAPATAAPTTAAPTTAAPTTAAPTATIYDDSPQGRSAAANRARIWAKATPTESAPTTTAAANPVAIKSVNANTPPKPELGMPMQDRNGVIMQNAKRATMQDILEWENKYGAPKKEKGGIVPGTEKGTTVTVGEKGKPEAIVPLDMFQLLGEKNNSNGDSSNSTLKNIIKLANFNENLTGVTSKQVDTTLKNIDQTKDSIKISELNNKSIDKQTSIIDDKLIKSINAETTANDKLIISMNKVTDMLPNVLSQIISAFSPKSGGDESAGAPAGAPSGASGGVPIPQPSTSGGIIKAGSDMLKKIGLIFSPGRDIQKENGAVDPNLINIAKKVQETIPGFSQFTGFNDVYHNENTPKSQHTKGKAFDFTVNKTPSKEEGDKIKSQLKALGLDLVKDEYNDTSGAFRTGGHFHGQLNAYDGGVFEPKPGGVHVNLAEAGLREAAVPLNPGEKIRVEKSEQETNPPKKEPLSTVMANDNISSSKVDQSAEILAGIHDLMEDKFDSMISAIRDGNNISDKILKYSQV